MLFQALNVSCQYYDKNTSKLIKTTCLFDCCKTEETLPDSYDKACCTNEAINAAIKNGLILAIV